MDLWTRHRGLQATLRAFGGAESKLKQIPELQHRAERLSQAFDQELARVYRDPQSARQAFESIAQKQGATIAGEAMKRRPEAFGQVVEDERKKWLGLATESSRSAAYQAARSAAAVGQQYVQANAQIPSTSEHTLLRATVAQKGKEVRKLQRDLGQMPSSRQLVGRIGRRAATLTPRQMGQLQKVLTPKQISVVTQAVSKALEVLKGRRR